MSHYRKGADFERKIVNHLIENGYFAMRAAGSKGGSKADIIAFKPGQLLLIQAKTDGKLSAAEWNQILKVAGWVGGVPLLAMNGARGQGVLYRRLLGPKIPRSVLQPIEPFLLDEVVA